MMYLVLSIKLMVVEKLSNVAFIGKVHAAGNRGGYLTGIVGENWKGIVEKHG